MLSEFIHINLSLSNLFNLNALNVSIIQILPALLILRYTKKNANTKNLMVEFYDKRIHECVQFTIKGYNMMTKWDLNTFCEPYTADPDICFTTCTIYT